MTKARDKIAAGLREAIAVARGEEKPARMHVPVKPAPGHSPMTPEERHADMMRRFPRTMAYLAEH